METEAVIQKVSKLSHDLRNALSVVYSYAQVLELTLQTPAQKEAHQAALELIASIQAMEQLLTSEVTALKKTLSS